MSGVQIRKSMSISIDKINSFLLFVFLFNTVFVPNDTFMLKDISLILLLVINCNKLIDIGEKDTIVVFLFGFVLTTVTIIQSTLLTGDLIGNVLANYMGYILMLYPIIKKSKYDLEKVVMTLFKWMVLFIIFMTLLDFVNILPLDKNGILMWLHSSNNAMIGKGSHLPIGYAMFLKATPMLIVALPAFISKGEYLLSVATCVALILSGTRANMFMAVAIFAACIAYKNRKKVCILFCVFIMLAFVLWISIDDTFINFIVDMFERKSGSDETRTRTLESIFNLWKENPMDLIIGQGYSSEFYDAGSKTVTSNVELSYWNLLREIGLIGFIPMMIMFLYPAIKLVLRREHIEVCIGYLAYLVIAYTNPLLHSSTGLTVLLYMYYLCFGKNYRNG